MRSLRLVSLVLSLLAVPALALADGPATSYLKGKHDQVTRLLKAPAKDRAGRDGKIAEIIAGIIDYQTLSRNALADEWSTRSESERAEFAKLLRQLVERNYKQSLENTLEYSVRYVDETREDGGSKVMTRARDAKNKRSPEVEILYSLEARGEGWAVTDVTTDGVSMVANYRSQFRRIIQKDGWAGLIDRMKRRLAEGGEL